MIDDARGGGSESASGDCKCFSQKQDGTFENAEATACVMSQTVLLRKFYV